QKKLFPTLKEGYFLVLRSEGTYDVQKVRSSLEKQLCQPFILYEVNDVIVVLVLSSEFIRKEEQLTVVRTIQIGLGATIFIGIGRSADSQVNLSLSYREAYT